MWRGTNRNKLEVESRRGENLTEREFYYAKPSVKVKHVTEPVCVPSDWWVSSQVCVCACTFGCHICVCTGMFAHHCYNIVCVCVGGGGEWICIQHLTPELPREIYYLYFSNYGTDPEKYTKFETCNSNSLTAPILKYKHTDWAIINHLIHWFLIKNYITVYEIFIKINI